MKPLWWLLFWFMLGIASAATPAKAQTVQQSGAVTPGHATAWVTSGVVQDAGSASNPQLNSLGLYGLGGTPFCITNTIYSGIPTGEYSQLCLGLSASSGYLTLNSYGGATALPWSFIINGNTALEISNTGTFQPGLSNGYIFVGNASNVGVGVPVSGDATLANTGALTVGSIGGEAVSLSGALSTSGANALTLTTTGTTNVTLPTSGTLLGNHLSGGYLFVGNGSGVATGVAMSGDCGIVASGAITCTETNGTAFGSLATLGYDTNFGTSSGKLTLAAIAAGDVLGNSGGSSSEPTAATVTALLDRNFSSTQGAILYRDASAWKALGPGTAGQALETGGAGANPVWTSITGTGTVTSIVAGKNLNGGTITTTGTISLSDTPGLGTNGTTAGTLTLANGNSGGYAVTIQNPSNTGGAYNFNLPATAGTSGYLLTSAGGSSSPMTWTAPTSLTVGVANALASATTTVNVSSATAPSANQVLTATSGTAATWQTPGTPTLGSALNAKMSVTSASATATFTADQVLVATALNGAAQLLPSYSQSINLGTTGAGGMDTGSAPTSGFVSLYAIWGSSGTSILACNVTTSTATIYAGANMPSGYTYSALIGVWQTNGSGQFPIGIQRGRTVFNNNSTPLLNGGTQTSYTSISLSSIVPPNATSILGYVEAVYSSAAQSIIVAADSNGTGFIQSASALSGSNPTTLYQLPIITSQTAYYKMSGSGSTGYFYVSGYSF